MSGYSCYDNEKEMLMKQNLIRNFTHSIHNYNNYNDYNNYNNIQNKKQSKNNISSLFKICCYEFHTFFNARSYF